jgi:translation initiation factor 1
MTRKDRIPLNIPSTGWNTPFDRLSAEGLPLETTGASQTQAAPTKVPQTVRRGRVVLRRETAHRGGKTVVVVDAFEPQVTNAYIEELAGKLKRACGCGGTTKGRVIEIQGDQPARIRALLEAEGFRVAGVS